MLIAVRSVVYSVRRSGFGGVTHVKDFFISSTVKELKSVLTRLGFTVACETDAVRQIKQAILPDGGHVANSVLYLPHPLLLTADKTVNSKIKEGKYKSIEKYVCLLLFGKVDIHVFDPKQIEMNNSVFQQHGDEVLLDYPIRKTTTKRLGELEEFAVYSVFKRKN